MSRFVRILLSNFLRLEKELKLFPKPTTKIIVSLVIFVLELICFLRIVSSL